MGEWDGWAAEVAELKKQLARAEEQRDAYRDLYNESKDKRELLEAQLASALRQVKLLVGPKLKRDIGDTSWRE